MIRTTYHKDLKSLMITDDKQQHVKLPRYLRLLYASQFVGIL